MSAGSAISLHHVSVDGSDQDIRALLATGVPVDERDYARNTPLFVAATHQNLAAAEALLEACADVEAQNMHGNAPLWAATIRSQGNPTVVCLLLAHGADADRGKEAGRSPRMLAEMVANFDLKSFFNNERDERIRGR